MRTAVISTFYLYFREPLTSRVRSGARSHVLNAFDFDVSQIVFEGKKGFHAGFVETSMMENVKPDVINYDELNGVKASDWETALDPGVFIVRRVSDVSQSGIVDTPGAFKRADRKKGKKYMDEVIKTRVKYIKDLTE